MEFQFPAHARLSWFLRPKDGMSGDLMDLKLFEEAMRDRRLIRVVHGGEPFDGRIVAISDELLAMRIIDHGIRYDGVVVLRTESVEDLISPHPQSGFYELALAARKQFDEQIDTGLDVSSMSSLLNWCRQHLELAAVHLTSAEPGVCYIGKILTLSDEVVVLREVGADAQWIAEERELILDEIERVD